MENFNEKYDYIYDIFKGICEMNSINLFKAETTEYELPKDSYVYYIETTKQDIELGIISGNISNPYRHAEIINIGIKFLEILKYKNIKIILKQDYDFKEILESLEINTTIDKDLVNSYEIVCEEKTLIIGNLDNNVHHMTINFKDVAKNLENIPEKTPLDIIVISEQEESLNDAFIIATELKDLGFKTTFIYEPINVDKVKDIDSTYIVSLNEELMSKFKVNLIDTKTHEEKIVSINDLEDELYINF